MSSGHIPMRMCVGCRQMKHKRELLRLKNGEGRLYIDPSRKGQGRGAYLCPDRDCLARAIRNRAFDRAFHMRVSDDLLKTLNEEM